MIADQALRSLAEQYGAAVAQARRPSDKAKVREEYAASALSVLKSPDPQLTDADKIAGFDRLRALIVGNLITALQRSLDGRGFRQEKDHDHYVYEEAVQVVLGRDAFAGINPMETLAPRED